jgi:hypothetical protein
MRNPRRFTSAVVLLTLAALPLALMRVGEAAPKKPASKPADSASASASATATEAPTPPPTPAAATTPDTTASDSDAAKTTKTSADASDGTQKSAAPTDDSSDVAEKPGKTYYFVGARYRGTIIPKFMMNLFVDQGATVYSNTVGIELDMRKDDESKVFALSYVEYGTGDILFAQKGKNLDDPGNWSYVNSGLKAIYATVDLLWSAPLHRNLQFEYGFGAGIGVVFGDLVNNWVSPAAAGTQGQLNTDDGKYHFNKCVAEGPIGCNKANHQNADTAKVGPTGYIEKSWFGGGSVPNVFLHLAIPQIGLRFKPTKQIAARLGLGFSLTGFWFGLSADYGLERPDKKSESTGSGPTLQFGKRY